MDKLVVTVLGIGAIVFVYWFFLMKKEQAVAVGDAIEIVVNGGYRPAVIEVQRGRSLTLRFFRTDPSPCLEEVVLGDFRIRKFLPVNERVSVTITPTSSGTYVYSCGMNRFHGTIQVKE